MNRQATPPARRATYQDVIDAPADKIAEIVRGALYLHPRPLPRHSQAIVSLGAEISTPFAKGRGGPGGWSILIEPELHLGEDVLVPDVVGWRRERLPALPDTVGIPVVPDWACEVLSPSTRRYDLTEKRDCCAGHGVAYLWLVDPQARTLEACRLVEGAFASVATIREGAEVRLPPFEAIAFPLSTLGPIEGGRAGMVTAAVGVWLIGWLINAQLASRALKGVARLLPPIVFGVTLLLVWELLVRGLNVSPVLLPAPSAIWARLLTSGPTLRADVMQTFVKGALSGYAIGCGAAFLMGVAVDRIPFLRRGLLPVGNFVAALPVVGMAPIMVMWFGFDWQSKAAVVVLMVFFPMLVNTVQGLAAPEAMQRDLMRTYAAGYWQTLFYLQLPAAAPFIFNGLKICTTLALIGAIVAEFFGSPTVGMGFRISTEVGRLSLGMVWAEITMAAVVGSAFYGAVALVERAATFWHPSQRR